MVSNERVRDRRVQKTQKLLHEALFSLIHERDFDSIAIKEILHRANVGRSTFYEHFRDKEELLGSGIVDLLRPRRPASLSAAAPCATLIWFSLPILEHIEQLRAAGKAGISARGRILLHEHLEGVLAGLIGEDVKKSLQGRRKSAPSIPADILTEHVVSTFIRVLNWWLAKGGALNARQANDLFRALIMPTLSATLT